MTIRCQACDKALNNKETSRKSVTTGEYLDLCDPCFSTIKDDVLIVENEEGEAEGLGLVCDDLEEEDIPKNAE